MAVLTLWWGCSSDSDGSQSPANPDEEATVESVFTPSEKPTWAIDWIWNDMAVPADWKDPAPFTSAIGAWYWVSSLMSNLKRLPLKEIRWQHS